MTLIEIMIVIVILAMAATGLTLAVGAIARTKLKSSCMRIASAARFAYNRAATSGDTIRITLDLDSDPSTMALEQAHGRVTLSRLDDPRRRTSIEEGDDGTVVDPWAAARARLEETMQPTFGASPFSPIASNDGTPLRRYQTQPIGSGIRVVRLVTPHEPDPREEGKGAIYFFPGGQSEHAVVQLSDGGDDVFSVEIRPLTGRAIVHSFAFEPEPIRDRFDDEGLSEAEDPG
jgi:general secretion pathway protein H